MKSIPLKAVCAKMDTSGLLESVEDALISGSTTPPPVYVTAQQARNLCSICVCLPAVLIKSVIPMATANVLKDSIVYSAGTALSALKTATSMKSIETVTGLSRT